MTFFGWSTHFSLNDHYTSIKTQSNKLERVNILNSDIISFELEETTLSNSGQQAWLSKVQKNFVELSTYDLLWLIDDFSLNDHYTSIKKK